MSKEIELTLSGGELFLVTEALTLLRRQERKELARVGKLIETWGPNGHDVLDLESLRYFESWRRERIKKITELRDRTRGDAQFVELAEIESLREEMENE